jgi:hypothetical protein
MAYRRFDTGTWGDPWFEGLSKDAKLAFIYLFTNDRANQAGMYEISAARIKADCGVNLQTVADELAGKVLWDRGRSIVWVKSFFRNQRQNPSFTQSAVAAIANLPADLQAAWHSHNSQILDADGIPPFTPPDTITSTIIEQNRTEQNCGITVTPPCTHGGTTVDEGVNVSGKKEKKRYLDYVMLTDDEHRRLISKYGTAMTGKAIEILNQYLGSTGKRYKSHYYTLLGWPMERAQGNNGGTPAAKITRGGNNGNARYGYSRGRNQEPDLPPDVLDIINNVNRHATKRKGDAPTPSDGPGNPPLG